MNTTKSFNHTISFCTATKIYKYNIITILKTKTSKPCGEISNSKPQLSIGNPPPSGGKVHIYIYIHMKAVNIKLYIVFRLPNDDGMESNGISLDISSIKLEPNNANF